MADIRKRVGKKGTTYQVRYPSKATKSGYAFKSFDTLKEARAFREDSKARQENEACGAEISTIDEAIDKWLFICATEGTDGNEPVTSYTLKNYEYVAKFMRSYPWEKSIQGLHPPDIVKFRSWLLENCPSRFVARRTLSCFQTVLREMALRGYVAANVATGITVSSNSRYDQPITPPTLEQFRALLSAADRLANSKNAQVAKSWERYRPMLYLAGDTGMRPGEYLALPRFNLSKSEVKVDRAVERSGLRISVTKTPAGWRWIDLSPETSELVNYYAERLAHPSEYELVFPTASGKWQCINNWRNRAFAAVCLEAGLVKETEENGKVVTKPKYTPYDLRHFYASMLIEQRVNLKRIQKLMGHTNITTTLNIYGHLIERAEEAGDKRSGLIASLPENSCGKSVAGAH
ncbi:MAG: tyrosine-type recombinase/integrase [Candidatus Thiodiazotropha sp. (ex Troendleina suluensis)]|nr:tyrosine-type recombinase/integrase [Candidatus Thiodiazotropha sp. (ex Troendleina suluensis)]